MSENESKSSVRININVEFKLKLGEAGRIVLPKAFRDAYNLSKGDFIKIKIIEIEKTEKDE